MSQKENTSGVGKTVALSITESLRIRYFQLR